MEIVADQQIDLSGLDCPLPILRTKRALSGMAEGKLLVVITTNPSSATDIPKFADLSGTELVKVEQTTDGHRFFLRK